LGYTGGMARVVAGIAVAACLAGFAWVAYGAPLEVSWVQALRPSAAAPADVHPAPRGGLLDPFAEPAPVALPSAPLHPRGTIDPFLNPEVPIPGGRRTLDNLTLWRRGTLTPSFEAIPVVTTTPGGEHRRVTLDPFLAP